jgi:hypothetical protein
MRLSPPQTVANRVRNGRSRHDNQTLAEAADQEPER